MNSIVASLQTVLFIYCTNFHMHIYACTYEIQVDHLMREWKIVRMFCRTRTYVFIFDRSVGVSLCKRSLGRVQA